MHGMINIKCIILPVVCIDVKLGLEPEAKTYAEGVRE
jgi:hypothetical protein